jgi:hypothetical protein
MDQPLKPACIDAGNAVALTTTQSHMTAEALAVRRTCWRTIFR